MNQHFRVGSFCLAVFLLSAVAGVFPASALPLLELTAGPLMDPMTMQPMGVENGGGTFDFDGTTSMENMWSLIYDINVDVDPFVSANFTFQNMSGVTQSFILNVTLPITPPVVPSSLMGGSTGGSVTDANNDGSATVGTVMGSPMYQGEIDLAGVLPIYPHLTSFSAPFAGGTTNIPAANVGLPGPTIPGPAANTSIGITHKFTLTPGDTVAFTSFFVVTPEPGTLMLVGTGLVCLLVSRRRRR